MAQTQPDLSVLQEPVLEVHSLIVPVLMRGKSNLFPPY